MFEFIKYNKDVIMEKNEETTPYCPDCNSTDSVAFSIEEIYTYYKVGKNGNRTEQKSDIPQDRVEGRKGYKCLNCGYMEFND